VKELGLSSRAFTVLDSAGIKTVRQLSAKSDAELLATRNIGKTILHEIREKLMLPLSTITVSRWTIEEQLRQPRAYDLIVRAEEQIRRFIEYNLMKHYGEHWLTNGISPAIQKKVINRTQALHVNWTVTDFLRKLDFGDYKTVILHPLNWRPVFSRQIKDRKAIAARLTELNAYRRSVAHSRPLSKAEFFSLTANVKGLVRQLKLRR